MVNNRAIQSARQRATASGKCGTFRMQETHSFANVERARPASV